MEFLNYTDEQLRQIPPRYIGMIGDLAIYRKWGEMFPYCTKDGKSIVINPAELFDAQGQVLVDRLDAEKTADLEWLQQFTHE
jgi:hypothetical protein